MYQDVIELRDFYTSPLGRITSQLLRRQIALLWPDTSGMDIMGLGYPEPYLDVFRASAARTISVMPAAQGVIRWPADEDNLTALAHEDHLPLKDAAMDRILMIHTLEHTVQQCHLLREVWRTLAPGGRVMIIVPNRLGLWARTDRTPFGHGTPFSALQLRQLLSQNMLAPTRTLSALHLPPFKSHSLLSLMTTFEGTGQRWWYNLAGALIIEAEKQIYAASPKIGKSAPMPRPAIAGNHIDSRHTAITTSGIEKPIESS